MRPVAGAPDPKPPGLRALQYAVLCWMIRHPWLWRALGATLRRWTWLARATRTAARRSSVREVLLRPRSFSNASHVPNLVAGDFLIGMEPGPTYANDRALFKSFLQRLNPGVDAAQEARKRCSELQQPANGGVFDLVDDYLVRVVLRAIRPAFGSAADGLIAGKPGGVPDRITERRYVEEVRHVAAQLFAGEMAPLAFKRRAELSAAALRARIDAMLPQLLTVWPEAHFDAAAVRRNAIGLAWVSHPVTVQAGALIVQELLGRPTVYDRLRADAGNLGEGVWTNTVFHQRVRQHVLELMRFRPVFPLLARAVPRATEFVAGGRVNPACPAGSSVTVLSISAMFDPRELDHPSRYCAQRDWGQQPDDHLLMFGLGTRQCIARDQALEILTIALIGVVTLPRLRWADRWGSRIGYDGPMISRMRLRLAGA
jgi:hypothetical protein